MENTKTVKALKKQLVAAIAMVLVAAVALGSSTYAWFVSNNTVKATTATISAQSNAPFLMIDKTNITKDSTTTISFSELENTALYPAQVVKAKTGTSALFQSAYASGKDTETELANSRYDVGNAETAVTDEFAIKETFKIGTYDEKAGSFSNLKVSKVEVVTGAENALGLKKAISVLLVCGDKWAVYKASADGAVLDKYSDGTTSIDCTATDGILAATIAKGKSVDVEAYVFYDGSEANVKTSNITNLKDCNVTLTFTATPMNTQGTAVDVTNEAK